MPKVSQEYMEARRSEILSAALRTFSRNGFHKTTMQDIFEEADLSAGAIYRYFKSKDEIIDALCRDSGEQESEWLKEALEQESPAASLAALMVGYFGSLQEPGERAMAPMWVHIWSETVRRSLEHGNSSFLSDVINTLATVIGQAQQKGDIAAELDPESTARVLVSTYQGLVLQIATGQDVDIDGYLKSLHAMVFGQFWVSDTDTPSPHLVKAT